MRFDLPTLSALSGCLTEHLSDRQIVGVEHGTAGLQLSFHGERFLRLTYGIPAALSLVAGHVGGGEADVPISRADRFLLGAVFVAAEAAQRDRCLWLRLQRPDRDGKPTYGRLYLELIGPRFRAVLASERRGHALGFWQAASDRRAASTGSAYRPPDSDRIIPGEAEVGQLSLGWDEGEQLKRWLTRRLAGATGAIASVACERAHIDQTTPASELSPDQWLHVLEIVQVIYTSPATKCWAWRHAETRQVSVIEPPASIVSQPYESLLGALAEGEESVSTRSDLRLQAIEQFLRRRKGRLEASLAAMQQDITQAETADTVERHGSLLLAAASQIKPGAAVVEIPDPYAEQEQLLRFEIPQGKSVAQEATGLLKLAQKFRRRIQILPLKILETEAQLAGVGDLLQRVDRDNWNSTEEELVALETQMGETQQSGRGRPNSKDERHGARPRRYRTSSGWSVWAGRNNQENDTLTHRLAAQNDYWFHAHGYAGSHVLLRRDGRKQEPDRQALEEAAAVAAYWSKGRTASKVPVVYTMAKYVSKPRGAPAGLAVMKREKTVMVRPELLPEDDDA
ncbi:MAG: DUF814 domain-containing protein [Gemmatimonadetes bacterium]|nr:DUF814 domain-containing protein [Gemmatimonadota bacterium]